MICRHCRRGGNLQVELRTRWPNGRPGGDRMDSNRYNGHVRRINNAHRDCPGGSWCDCQHVGTPHVRKAGGQPVALVSAGLPALEPTGTPGVMKTTHRPRRRTR